MRGSHQNPVWPRRETWATRTANVQHFDISRLLWIISGSALYRTHPNISPFSFPDYESVSPPTNQFPLPRIDFHGWRINIACWRINLPVHESISPPTNQFPRLANQYPLLTNQFPRPRINFLCWRINSPEKVSGSASTHQRNNSNGYKRVSLCGFSFFTCSHCFFSPEMRC